MSDTPITDAVKEELRPFVDAKSLDVFDIAMDKMAKLERKLIETRNNGCVGIAWAICEKPECERRCARNAA